VKCVSNERLVLNTICKGFLCTSKEIVDTWWDLIKTSPKFGFSLLWLYDTKSISEAGWDVRVPSTPKQNIRYVDVVKSHINCEMIWIYIYIYIYIYKIWFYKDELDSISNYNILYITILKLEIIYVGLDVEHMCNLFRADFFWIV
jgi:hypothetical protein